MKTVGIYTLGCKVSQYESEAIGEEFEARGFRLLPFAQRCDAYVINTCTVTAESDRKCRQVIRRAKAKNGDAVIAVVGCYSQRAPDELLDMGCVSVVLGTRDKLSVVDRVCEAFSAPTPKSFVTPLSGAEFEKMKITRAPRTRAYVKIQDGCESKCTYCAIAAARGPVRSKPKDEVISEVEALYKSGTREIVLTGIETGSYGRDFKNGYGLCDLICELSQRGSCDRIRLGSLAPELIDGKFIEKIKDMTLLVPHFHLSVQSGSDTVLRRMKRRYNTDRVRSVVKGIREKMPNACFTTDLMVGFPGESEEEFMESCRLVEEIGFIDAHVFAYSKRAGTPAAEYEAQVDEAVKSRRSRELIALKNNVRDRTLSAIVERGEPLSVILESYDGEYYSAHSDEFAECRIKGCPNLEGEYARVVPISHSGGVISGQLIKICK